MGSLGDLHAALADETGRRQLAEVRLAHCQRELAEAQKTIQVLTQFAASKPGLTEVGVIAQAALA
jgi:bacterioferritin (cytochrome b1)